MKLLNELISLRRIGNDDAEGAAEENAIRRREDSRYSHDDDLTPGREYGVGFVDDDPDAASEDSEVSDTEGLDDVSDDMGRLDNKQGGDDYQDVSPDNPYEEGTPEHEAWVAGYEAAIQDGGAEQDVEMDREEFPDETEVGGEDMGDEPSTDEVGEEPPVEELPVEDEEDDVDFYTDKNWRDRYGRHEAPEDERAFSNTALTQGEKAFNQGNPVSSNPYERGTLKSNEWLEGFRCGEQEASQRNASWWTGPGREADEDEESPSSATDQGYEAYVNGKGRDANPFQRGTTDYNDWNEAWTDARESTRYDGRPGDEDCEVGTMIGGNKNYGVEDEGENEGEFKSRLYPVRGVKQAIAPDDDWYDTIPHGNIQKFDVPPRGSRLTYQIHAPHDTYRPGAVEAEIYRSPDGKHYYREILTGDNDEQWFYIPNRVLKQLLPYDAQRRNQETEDEGENVWGDNAYGQQGAHMGGVKKTDIGEPTPDASSELDPNNDLGDNEAGDELEQALGGEEGDPKLDALTDKTAEDPDRQGLVRKVKGAHLVYKRQIEDGTYEELWIYNSGNLRDELDIRKAVLAGTDIPTSKTTSPDGTQKYELWSAGNAEMLQIKGLPN